MQATEPLSPPSGLVQGIPEAVEKVLYKALAHNPQDRYENMDAFALALRGLLAEAETDEPIQPQKDTRKTEPAPTAPASTVSESVTRDALDATPVEEMQATPKGRQGLPKWALWAIGGIIGLALITLAFNLGSKSANISNEDNSPVASAATETEAVVSIPTNTSAPTKTVTITPTLEPTLGIGSTMINEKDGAEMVYVPAGEFLMGSEDAEADNDEAPEHTVYLDAYWIYKNEVTNEQYGHCIEDGVCNGDLSQYPENNYSADYINWYEASDYCEWAGGRLPTEAEWEKAARGEDGRTYPWGETSPNCSLAQYNDCSGGIVSVGSFPAGASPYGALDMAGNVWEWLADWYDADYYRISPGQNPTGPASGTYRVIRGGSWYDIEGNLRASGRSGFDPDDSYYDFGFRCVPSGF